MANRILGFVNAPSLFQRVIAKCLDAEVDVNIYKKNRDLLYGHLTKIGFSCVKPQGAFYLFPKSLIQDDVEFAKEAKARGILYVVIKDKVNPDQTEVMVFADDAAKMNRVLDRMNLDFVKAESGSMVTEAVEKETAPEKAENQMEKETGENVRTETVVLPEGKIEFELDDAEEMFQIGDEAFPEGNFTQAQEGEEKNPSEPFSRNRNTVSYTHLTLPTICSV